MTSKDAQMTEPNYPPSSDQPQHGEPQYGQQQPYGQPQYGQQGSPPQYGQQDSQFQYGQPQYASDQVQGGYYGPAAVTRPPAIDKAVLMMKIGAALSIVSGLLSLTMRSAYREAAETSLRNNNQPLTPQTIDIAVNTAVGAGIASGLIGAGLWWWIAVMNGKGRGWARIVATIFFGISLLTFVLGLRGGNPIAATLLSAALVVVGAAAVFFLWQRESSDYYEAASRRP